MNGWCSRTCKMVQSHPAAFRKPAILVCNTGVLSTASSGCPVVQLPRGAHAQQTCHNASSTSACSCGANHDAEESTPPPPSYRLGKLAQFTALKQSVSSRNGNWLTSLAWTCSAGCLAGSLTLRVPARRPLHKQVNAYGTFPCLETGPPSETQLHDGLVNQKTRSDGNNCILLSCMYPIRILLWSLAALALQCPAAA